MRKFQPIHRLAPPYICFSLLHEKLCFGSKHLMNILFILKLCSLQVSYIMPNSPDPSKATKFLSNLAVSGTDHAVNNIAFLHDGRMLVGIGSHTNAGTVGGVGYMPVRLFVYRSIDIIIDICDMMMIMYLFTTVPHPHGHWQLQELLGNHYYYILLLYYYYMCDIIIYLYRHL